MLKSAQHIIVIGCGGIGSWLIPPLETFLSADRWPGRLTFIDGDKYEDKNKNRQDFNHDLVGVNKAEVQAAKVRVAFPSVNVQSIGQYVDDENIASIVVENSVVFVCVDNHPARARIDKRARDLEEVCVFSAGNEMHDGNVTVSLRRYGEQITPPMVDRHPEIATIKTNDRAAGCEDLIDQGEVQLLITNFMAAGSALVSFHMLWDPPDPKAAAESLKGKKKKLKPCDMPKQTFPQEIYFDVKQGKMETIHAELKSCGV